MTQIVFTGVSPRSLGDLLKGYGIMAILGEYWPEALFWWDDGYHLVSRIKEADGHVKKQIEKMLSDKLIDLAKNVGGKFRPRRGKKCGCSLPCPYHGNVGARRGKSTCQEGTLLLRTLRFHHELGELLARYARGVAIPLLRRSGRQEARKWRDETEPHPLFPAHGQEGSGDYFSQLEKAAKAAKKAEQDIAWSLWGNGPRPLRKVLESGYLFFPESMKRYATGLARWEREKDAVRSPWDFLLAVRGLLLFRGSLRRMRWRHSRPYAAFPFVFEGSTVHLGGERFFRNVEIHLPTWTADHPRTLKEFEMQIWQFQARLSARGFAATAAEFRAAVVGRGVGAAFDTFHRFVLEGRRPGRGQQMRQGIPRGTTRVGGKAAGSGALRIMLAPIAETGWFDQFRTDRLRAARARAEEAIHRAVDEPGLEAYRGVLEALWDLNRSILVPGALSRDLEGAGRTPRPLLALPPRHWEEALRDGLRSDPAYRLGRAIGSITGVKGPQGNPGVGPLLEHLLPVRYDWDRKAWVGPEQVSSRELRWAGLDPLGDFRQLLWWRWLDSAELERLPFGAMRYASLDDIAALLRGDVDVQEIHRLTGLFALLDWWRSEAPEGQVSPPTSAGQIPPAYVALRLWLELGIDPAHDSRPPRDGAVVRLLAIGQPAQVERAAERALARLRVDGLPWEDDPRPTGKAVARFQPRVPPEQAARMALAVMVPISKEDRLALSRRLWVPLDEQEATV